MGKYSIKPGIIHIGTDALSPYVHTSTVIVDKNTKLKTILDETYRKYYERNKPTWERVTVNISPDDWIAADGMYKYHIISYKDREYMKYNIICETEVSISNMLILLANERYKFIKSECIDGEVYTYTNVKPKHNIRLDILTIWTGNTLYFQGTPKNLKVNLKQNKFTVLDDENCMYKVNVGDLDLATNHFVTCTFDNYNMQKFLQSNNRFITASYSYGEITIYTEFPFDATVILIIHRC